MSDRTPSKAFTFSVNMIIEIIAQNPDEARAKLDDRGGYITERNVEILATTELPRPDLDSE